MRSEPARLGGISLEFAGIPPRWDENFPYEHAQVGQPGKPSNFLIAILNGLLNPLTTNVSIIQKAASWFAEQQFLYDGNIGR